MNTKLDRLFCEKEVTVTIYTYPYNLVTILSKGQTF